MMRIRTFTGSLITALMIFAAAQATAQVNFKGPPTKMGIVDVQGVLRESIAAKSAREQMDSIARKEQATLAEDEKKLRAEDLALQQQRAILTPEVFAQRQQKLQADVRSLQSKSRALRQTLDQGFRRTMDQIQLVLFDELRKLSGELDLNVILSRSQIVIATDDFDLTKPALERLNKRLPSIKLNLTKGADAGKAR